MARRVLYLINTIDYNPPTGDPHILYYDEDIIVANKAPGLLSVPGRGEDKKDCLLSRVSEKYPDALIVHRLDMPTSGIIVLARSAQVHKQLSQQFQQRKIAKQYIAVVHGLMENQSGEIDLPLITDWPNRPKQKVDYDSGKPSLTHFKVLELNKNESTTRVRLTPITGRSHQLRVHLLSIGHRIVGDELYGSTDQLNKGYSRLLLHANKIEFTHPTTNEVISFDCPCEF